MLEPMFGFLFGLEFVASILALLGIILVGFIGFLTLFTIRKIPPGKAGVRVGFRGYVISDT